MGYADKHVCYTYDVLKSIYKRTLTFTYISLITFPSVK